MATAAVGIAGIPTAAAASDDVIDIDYDEYSDPGEIYRVWTCAPRRASFTGEHAYSGGQALEIALSAGSSCGTNTHLNVENALGYQPTEIHDSFMFRLSDNWRMNDNDQCKILRTAMSYSAGGGHSGGGNATGTNGWSAGIVLANRGSGARNGGPYNLSAYLYHMDSTSQDNDGYYGNGLIEPGKWYRFETYCKLNSIENGRAQRDGIYRIWVDGDLIYERTNLRWTEDYANNAIEYSGPYARYGGGETAPRNMAAYFDDHAMYFEQGRVDLDEPPEEEPSSTEPPTGDFTLTLGGNEDLNEYLLELDAEAVEPGENANTHEHAYQDRAIEVDGRWYVHGYTSSGGVDDFAVTGGEILRVGVLNGDVEVTVDDNTLDLDAFDSIESIPDPVDEDEENASDESPTGDFTLTLGGNEDLNEYLLEMDAEAVEPGESANTHEHDYQDRAIERDGRWYVHGYTSSSGVDDFAVTGGEILRVGVLDGDVEVTVDDNTLDLDAFDSIGSIPDPKADFTLECSGTSGVNEYLLELDAEAVEPGANANTHEHAYQDRAIERDGRWYVHGYTSPSGVDDFAVTDGRLLRVGVLDGDIEVAVDGEPLDLDAFDSINAIPDSDE